MKALKVGIAGYNEMKTRTLAIASGKLKPAPNSPKIWFTSVESFAKVLSQGNRDLLRAIAEQHPESLESLAGITGRSKSNLSRTLKTMARYGLLRLARGARDGFEPNLPAIESLWNCRLHSSRTPDRPRAAAQRIGYPAT